MFREIPLVVVTVFFISLIECLFILPAHLGHKGKRRENRLFLKLHDFQQRFSAFYIRMVHTRYGPFLSLVLRWRYVSFSIGAMVLMLAFGYVKSGRMGFELFPKIESDYAAVTAKLPFGTAVNRTIEVEQALVEAGKAVAERNGGDRLVEGIYASVDGSEVSRMPAMPTAKRSPGCSERPGRPRRRPTSPCRCAS